MARGYWETLIVCVWYLWGRIVHQNLYRISFTSFRHPVRIRVRIEATEWGGPSEETGKTEVPCHSRCGTIKIPPCSKALSAEHGAEFCSPSPAMVTSPYKWNILERDTTDHFFFWLVNLMVGILKLCHATFFWPSYATDQSFVDKWIDKSFVVFEFHTTSRGSFVS
jgi:hypothetical protein